MISIIGSLVKTGLQIRGKAERFKERKSPYEKQRATLKKLMTKAVETKFGQRYGFNKLLHTIETVEDKHAFYEEYKKMVPVYSYNKMFDEWWNLCLKGEANVTWPGKIKYFALSSGTSEASTKHIPISRDMLRQIQKTGTRQIYTLPEYDLPNKVFTKGVLMLGGSTDLNNYGHYYAGDLSGIQTSRLPIWFQKFYKPGKRIAMLPEWNRKIEEMTLHAKDWDITVIAGVPAWVQMLMERVIEYYGLKNIHEIWPNLSIYAHGGVSFEPYRPTFKKLMGRPIIYMETYLASEGFLAYQYAPDRDMKLVLDNGIFFEFVPFNETNFDADGEVIAKPEACMIDQVEEGKEYAILLSTCAGAWRYLIGDTVKITNKEIGEMVITGRTKHFLSLCGEHLSVDNMTKAVALVSAETGYNFPEFTVAGGLSGTLFAHHWYMASDNKDINSDDIIAKIDDHLCVLNDDYRTERKGPLHEIKLIILPTEAFYGFMDKIGKVGGQNKFPRVLKGKQLDLWHDFIRENKY